MPAETTEVESIHTPTTEYVVAPGGFAVDPDTGEVIGMIDPITGQILTEVEVKQRFAVKDRETLEWAAHKLYRLRLEQQGIAARQAKLARQAKTLENAERSFFAYFGADMASVVQQETEAAHASKRSVDTDWGTMGFRKSPGSIKVVDEEAAIEWAKANCAEAVKVRESILTTPLKGHEESLPDDLFEVVPAGDKFYYLDGLPKPDKSGTLDPGMLW